MRTQYKVRACCVPKSVFELGVLPHSCQNILVNATLKEKKPLVVKFLLVNTTI